jgi:hypothetical protein
MRPGRTVFVVPAIGDELDEQLKNGLAIRNEATVSGVCPACGARGEWRPIEPGIWSVTFRHGPNCRALHDRRDLGEVA